MARKDFVPGEDKIFRDNFGVFVEEITDPDAPFAARYGIAPATQAQAQTIETELTTRNDRVVSLQQDLIEARGQYDVYKADTAIPFWRAQAKIIKGDADYTDTDGRVLKIEGKEIDPNMQGKTPVLRLTATAQGIAISYLKEQSDGIELFSQRGTESGLTLLKRITKTSWLDARPNLNPGVEELRNYAALFVQDDDEVGDRSATVSVVSPARL